MSAEEMVFFDRMPELLPMYEAFKEKLQNAYPDVKTKVTKTQISFSNRHVFAMVSLPWRKVRGWPEQYLLVSFGLCAEKKSPRVARAVEAHPNRWTHHVIVERREDIDGELMGWIDEAYGFSMLK